MSVFAVILVCIFPHSDSTRENADQNNSKFGHFLRSDHWNTLIKLYYLTLLLSLPPRFTLGALYESDRRFCVLYEPNVVIFRLTFSFNVRLLRDKQTEKRENSVNAKVAIVK